MDRCSLLTACLVVAGFIPAAIAKEPDKPTRPVVRVARPIKREVEDRQPFVGLVQPLQIVQLRPRVSSVITKVNFTAGQMVHKGDVLVELDPTTFEASMAVVQAEMEVAEANLARATMAVDRAKQLLPTRAISSQEFDQTAADCDQADGALKVAKAKLDVARIDLMFTKIAAPIDGSVSSSPLQSPGNTVTADTTDLAVLISTNPIAVYFDVDQEVALDLRDTPDPEATLWLPRAKEPLRGRIEWASNALDASTGTMRLRVLVPNDSGKLLPAMKIKGEFTTSRKLTQFLVAPAAVGEASGGGFVYLAERGDASRPSTIAQAFVVGGSTDDGMRYVMGLGLDCWVVVGDLSSLKPGMAVDTEQVEMPQPKAASPKKDD